MEKNLNLKQIQEFFSKPLEENTFKVGDKITYLGHPGEITATKEYNGRNFVSVSYDKGKGKTKASDILATDGTVKAVNEMDVNDPIMMKIKDLEQLFDFHTQMNNKGRASIIKDKIEKLRKLSKTGSPFFGENIAQTLAETIKLGEGVIEEELCAKGKAYRKRRMAAGEKSSAYLSGRAVKVCKGQMSGKKKKNKKSK